MRKRYRILMLAALVAAIAVPVGYALSLESTPVATSVRDRVLPPVAAAVVVAPATLYSGDRLPVPAVSSFPDAAKLLGVGTILFGLAAALRKSGQG